MYHHCPLPKGMVQSNCETGHKNKREEALTAQRQTGPPTVVTLAMSKIKDVGILVWATQTTALYFYQAEGVREGRYIKPHE